MKTFGNRLRKSVTAMPGALALTGWLVLWLALGLTIGLSGCSTPEVKPEVVVEETDDPAVEENLLYRADEPPRAKVKTASSPEEDEGDKGEENLLDRTRGGAK